MWDRGHAFVGANGAGSCLHVDQAPEPARGGRWLAAVGISGWWFDWNMIFFVIYSGIIVDE